MSGLDLSQGIDYREFAEITVRLGNAADTLFVEDTHLGKTSIRGGAGADILEIEQIKGETFVDGGTGNDDITVNRRLTVPTPVAGVNPIGATLSLDGQEGSDAYAISLAGEGSALINVKDSGGSGTGTDALVVNGDRHCPTICCFVLTRVTGWPKDSSPPSHRM